MLHTQSLSIEGIFIYTFLKRRARDKLSQFAFAPFTRTTNTA